MTAESKLRTLAQQSAELQPFFFSAGQLRWFDRNLPPGYLAIGRSCARVTRVSTIPIYSHGTNQKRSQNNKEFVRFQIDVLDYDAERARLAAKAIVDWLAEIDLSSNAQFTSPVTSPTCHANFLLNQRAGMEVRIQPPAYIEILDIRLINLDE